MTRILRNDTVELGLEQGAWTARWPGAGIALGPCTAEVDGASSRSSGSWRIATTRRGARARWAPAEGSTWVVVEIGADGPVLTALAGRHTATTPHVFTALRGATRPPLQPKADNEWTSTRLLLSSPETGAALLVQVSSAERWTTTIGADDGTVSVTHTPASTRGAASDGVTSESIALVAGSDSAALREQLSRLAQPADEATG